VRSIHEWQQAFADFDAKSSLKIMLKPA
jgi:hypothetical protein